MSSDSRQDLIKSAYDTDTTQRPGTAKGPSRGPSRPASSAARPRSAGQQSVKADAGPEGRPSSSKKPAEERPPSAAPKPVPVASADVDVDVNGNGNAAGSGAPAEGSNPEGQPPTTASAGEQQEAQRAASASQRYKGSIFRRFTSESYTQMLVDEEERKRAAEEEKKRREEEEKFLDEDQKTKDDGTKVNEDELFDPDLEDGVVLPRKLFKQLPPDCWYTPLEEIDEEIKARDRTFVVISRRLLRPSINRFSATPSLFIFSPWNPIRKAMIACTCFQFVEYFILITVITNSIFMAANYFGLNPNIPEYVFLGIYTAEWLMKMVAMGFVMNTYAYLRNGWNALDFVILVLSAITMIVTSTASGGSGVSLNGLRTLRVFRLFRTFSLIRGLRSIVTALLFSFKTLIQVIAVTVFYVFLTALLMMEFSQGDTHNWCVANVQYPSSFVFNSSNINTYWQSWVSNPSNYGGIRDRWGATSCNNYSYSATCTDLSGGNGAYTCLNVQSSYSAVYGYLNYDNIGYGVLNALQLATLDHWHNQFYYVMRTSTYMSIFFFVPFVSFGSYYIMNIILAVLVVAFEEETHLIHSRKKTLKKKWFERQAAKSEAENAKLEKQQKKKKADDGDADGDGDGDQQPEAADEDEKADAEETDAQTEEKPLKSAMKKKSLANGPPNFLAPDAGSVRAELPGETKRLGFDEMALTADENFDVRTLTSAITGEWTTSTTASSDLDSMDDTSMISGELIVVGDGNRDVIDRNCMCCKKAYQDSTSESSQRCYVNWLKAQNAVYRFVCDPLTEIFVMMVIILNILIMTLTWPNQDPGMLYAFDKINIACSCVYFLEAILKIFGMCFNYFKSGWNVFDFIIVIFTILDLSLANVSGLGVFKAFRLLRVFRLINQFQSMKEVLIVVLKSASNIGLLTAVLAIMMYIFAIIGMELYGSFYQSPNFPTSFFLPNYPTDTGLPKFHFADIGHSVMVIVRILCGDMFYALYDAWFVSGPSIFIVFIPATIICNFVFRNLFLALLLLIFQKPVPKSEHTSKFVLAWERFKQIFCGCCSRKSNAVGDSSVIEMQTVQDHQNSSQTELLRNDKLANAEDGGKANANGDDEFAKKEMLPSVTIVNETRQSRRRSSTLPLVKPEKVSTKQDKEKEKKDKKATKSKQDVEIVDPLAEEDDTIVPNCCCGCYYECCCSAMACPTYTPLGSSWYKFRSAVLFVVKSKVFDVVIVLTILISSIELCIEDIYLDQNVVLNAQCQMITYFTVAIFVIEMFLMFFAVGLKEYFTGAWYLLDFFIVAVSVADLGMQWAEVPSVSILTTLRALRALRPLRFIGKIESMKIMVASLMGGIWQILSAAVVTLLFWFIFSIIGVQLFQNQFWACYDVTRTWTLARLPNSVVANQSQCNQNANYLWMNAYVNFDNVAAGLVALLEVATTQGWIDVMTSATDMTTATGQPLTDNSPAYYVFFVAFIIIGVFFSLNLFVGVLAQNFSKYRKLYKGEHHDMLVNDNQRRFVLMFRHLSRISPPRSIPVPDHPWRNDFYRVSISTRFDAFILLCILGNCIALATSFYCDTTLQENIIFMINQVFYGVFIMECVIKIIGLGVNYFYNAWNVFDFSLVVINAVFQGVQAYYPIVSPIGPFVRILRLVRIVRVLQAMPSAHGLRKMITAYMLSLPAMVNIFILNVLIVFIYSIIGMQLYGYVQTTAYSAFDEFVNFQTFLYSFMLLFRVSTSSGWDQVLTALSVQAPLCNPYYALLPNGYVFLNNGGNCGAPVSAAFYMCTFIIITKIIILNLYTVVILDNYIQATELNRTGITEFDITTFFAVWAKFDPEWTQFVSARDIGEVCSELEEPLRMPQPNKDVVAQLKVPIREGERVHCIDLIRCIVIKQFGQAEYEEDIATAAENDPFIDFLKMNDAKFRSTWKGLEVRQIDTNYNRWRRLRAIRCIQRVWKKYTIKQRFVNEKSSEEKAD